MAAGHVGEPVHPPPRVHCLGPGPPVPKMVRDVNVDDVHFLHEYLLRQWSGIIFIFILVFNVE